MPELDGLARMIAGSIGMVLQWQWILELERIIEMHSNYWTPSEVLTWVTIIPLTLRAVSYGLVVFV